MKRRGSVSILLLLLFPCLLLQGMVMTENLRLVMAEMFVDQALVAVARSSLAHYDRETWERYGLLVTGPDDFGAAQKEATELFLANLDQNPLLRMGVLSLEVEPACFLDREGFRRQVLEGMKYVAPLRGVQVLRDLLDSRELADAWARDGEKAELLERAQDNVDEARENNRAVEAARGEIQSARQELARERKGPDPDPRRIAALEETIRSRERRIETLYDRNRYLTLETRRILEWTGMEEVPERTPEENLPLPGDLLGELAAAAAIREDLRDQVGHPLPFPPDRPGPKERTVKGDASRLTELLEGVSRGVQQGRDAFFLGEYALEHLSHLASDKGTGEPHQVEYLVTGSRRPGASYLVRLFATRAALDAAAYFLFDPAAPPELVARVAYALILGGLQGALDVYELAGSGERVPLMNRTPPGSTPLERIRLDYEDHLRIHLLMTGEEEKLDRLQELVPVEGITGVRVRAEVRLVSLFPVPEGWLVRGRRDGEGIRLERGLVLCY